MATSSSLSDADVRVHVVGCQNLMNKDPDQLSELTDPLVVVYLNNQPKPILITPVITNSTYPSWDVESASVDLRLSPGSVLIFQAWHRAPDVQKGGAFLGEMQISAERLLLSTARRSSTREQTGGDEVAAANLTDFLQARGKEPDTAVRSLSAVSKLGAMTIRCELQEVVEAQKKAADAAQAYVDHNLPLLGALSVLHAKNLLKRDEGPQALSDPYVTVRFPFRRRIVWTSSTQTCTLNPVWAADPTRAYLLELRGDPTSAASLCVHFEVWNANPRPERDSFLGYAMVSVDQLDEGVQKIPLTPRPDEVDGIIKRLEGRLGWLVVDWKPVDASLVAKTAERKMAKKLGMPPSAASAGTPTAAAASEFDAPTAAASQPVQSAIDTHVTPTVASQWTPAELNTFLLWLHAAAPMQPQPSQLSHGVAAASEPVRPLLPQVQSGKSNNNSSIPLPLDDISKFSPHYPHSSYYRDSQISQHVGAAPTIQAVADRPTPSSTAPAPTAVGGQRVEIVDPIATALQSTTDAAVAATACEYASVALTDLLPIRIVYNSQFYDTELHADEPLHRLQAEAHAMFLLHPSVQLFFHNGELKDVSLSLRRNGCLLLKGDPHLKLTMSVAKGPRRNLIFVFPDKREVSLAVEETCTIRQLKRLLADEFGEVRGLEALLEDPSRIRLLWRYNELNDKATVVYYNVPTNSKVNVAKKIDFFGVDATGGGVDTFEDDRFADEKDGKRRSTSSSTKRLDYDKKSATMMPVGGGGSGSSRREGGASHAATSRKSADDMRDERAPPASRAAVAVTSPTRRRAPSAPSSGGAAQRPTSGSRLGSSDGRVKSTERRRVDPNVADRAGGTQTDAHVPRPRGYYEAALPSAIDDAELTALRQTVYALERQVQSQTAQQAAAATLEQERRIAKLERDLTVSEQRYADSLKRIAELESTIIRYQGLLQRATQLT